MVLRWLVVALAVGAALPAGAFALDRGVVLDRDSPVGKAYALPLDAARVELSGLAKSTLHANAVRAGQAAPTSASAPGPVFGVGVVAPAGSGVGSTLRGLRELAQGGGEGVLAGALPAEQRLALLGSARAAARIPESGVLAGGGLPAVLVVLIGGALGGVVLRRLGLV